VSEPKKYSAEHLMTVVLAPVVSEKSTFVADKNRQYVFRVADAATKPQIRAAVELMFKTKVDSVTVANASGGSAGAGAAGKRPMSGWPPGRRSILRRRSKRCHWSR
jgi:large subunit ribosomal protein L23